MKIKIAHLLSLALFSTSLAGCPFGIDPWPCPWDHPCPTTPDAQPPVDDCAELVVQDPAVSLAGYTMYQPDEKRNNPNAGEPYYVYLAGGTEGVIVTGPSVTDAPGLFTVQSSSIAKVGVRSTSADGYRVVVNPSLSYDVAIEDFESEVGLARVQLCQREGKIDSRFLFRGEPGASGVAHQIAITATANGIASGPSAPVTVEVR